MNIREKVDGGFITKIIMSLRGRQKEGRR